MKPLRILAVSLLCFLGQGAGQLAFGWDNPGHMAVAGLAYDELSAEQKAHLVALLKQHPDLKPLTAGFPNGAPDGRSLVMAAATWPDAIRIKAFGYTDNGYEEKDPAIEKVAYSKLMHRGWHFIDTPVWEGTGPAPAHLPPPAQVNAVGVVKVLMKQLHGNEADSAKAYDLGWLLHLVGDLHQPLHAVGGITPTLPAGDRGGNSVGLSGVTDGEEELHSYWDDVLGRTAPSHRLDKDVATANRIITTVQGIQPTGSQTNPATWAAESVALAKSDAYHLTLVPSPAAKKPLNATLDNAYHTKAVQDAQQQIRTAGHRLAVLLKQIL